MTMIKNSTFNTEKNKTLNEYNKNKDTNLTYNQKFMSESYMNETDEEDEGTLLKTVQYGSVLEKKNNSTQKITSQTINSKFKKFLKIDQLLIIFTLRTTSVL